jgi:hypothetical protein
VSRIWLVAAVVWLVACKDSPGEQARKLRDTQHSWAATARLMTELQRRGAVPKRYARQALDVARQELDKTRQEAGKPPQ